MGKGARRRAHHFAFRIVEGMVGTLRRPPYRSRHKQKRPRSDRGRFFVSSLAGGINPFEKARKLLLEARDAAAAIHQLGVAAGPGRVRLRVDVEVQRVAFLAPGGAGQVLGSVGHHDLNRMIIRMNFGFHGNSSAPGACLEWLSNDGFGGVYTPQAPLKQAIVGKGEPGRPLRDIPDLPLPRSGLCGANMSPWVRSHERCGTA